jgi:hypothetical protein
VDKAKIDSKNGCCPCKWQRCFGFVCLKKSVNYFYTLEIRVFQLVLKYLKDVNILIDGPNFAFNLR